MPKWSKDEGIIEDALELQKNKLTSLHEAVLRDSPGDISWLLEQGADINARDSQGSTPLHLAVSHGSDKALGQLLELGANPRLRDCAGNTPLHLAMQHKSVGALTQLVPGRADLIDALDNEWHTPLHLAAIYNFAEGITHLVQHGGNLNATDQANKTPLHLALERGVSGAACLLIDLGADIHAATFEGQTALHLSVGDLQSLQLTSKLIHAGADLDELNQHEETPLAYIVRLTRDQCTTGATLDTALQAQKELRRIVAFLMLSALIKHPMLEEAPTCIQESRFLEAMWQYTVQKKNGLSKAIMGHLRGEQLDDGDTLVTPLGSPVSAWEILAEEDPTRLREFVTALETGSEGFARYFLCNAAELAIGKQRPSEESLAVHEPFLGVSEKIESKLAIGSETLYKQKLINHLKGSVYLTSGYIGFFQGKGESSYYPQQKTATVMGTLTPYMSLLDLKHLTLAFFKPEPEPLPVDSPVLQPQKAGPH